MDVPPKRRAAEGMKPSTKAKTRKYEKLGNTTIVEEDDPFDRLLDLDDSDADDEDESFHSNSDSDTDEDNCSEHHTDHSFDANAKIYPGHHLDIKTSMLVIWLYAISFGISSTQLGHLLGLLNLHFLISHPALSSVYRFKKYLVGVKSSFKKHYFCSTCHHLVTTDIDWCPNEGCPKRNLSAQGAKSYFLELDIPSQVLSILSRKNIQCAIKKSKSEKKSGLTDVTDGEIYQKLCAGNGPLSTLFPYNISFTLNTDGVNIVKSSAYSIWPVYLTINELPYSIRKQKHNMIVAGLWFSEHKPIMNMFLKPIVESLTFMERTGVSILVDGVKFICKAFLICATADIPVKAMLLEMKQHNGEYSCSKCLQPGSNFRTINNGNIRVFPYDEKNPSGPARNHNSFLDDASKAIDTGKPVHGIKGPCVLYGLSCFDLVKSVSIDYMHCVLQGICKLLGGLWFSNANAKEMFSLHSFLPLIEKRMKSLKSIHNVTRIPRSVTDIGHWKASEHRAWLLYFSVPILHDLMSSSYLYHWCSFVEAIYLLCQDTIVPNDLMRAEKLLHYFVIMFGPLYGERYMTINVLYLLHLTDDVRNRGPLWSHRCFPFESINGELRNLFHGTRFIDTQISNAVSILQQLPHITSEVTHSVPATKFIRKLKRCGFASLVPLPINIYNIEFLGKPFQQILPMHIQNLLPSCKLLFYRRVKYNGHLIHATTYERAVRSNSYTVRYFHKSQMKFGFVCWFANDGDNRIALVKCLEQAPLDLCKVAGASCSNPLQLTLKNVRPCYEPTGDKATYDVVKISDIICTSVCVNVENFIFVCHQPNTKEYNLWHYVCCEPSMHVIDLSSGRPFGNDMRAVSAKCSVYLSLISDWKLLSNL